MLAKAYGLVCLRLAATKNQDGYSWHPEPRDAEEGSLASQRITSYYHLDHWIMLTALWLEDGRTTKTVLEGTLAEARLQFLFE